jgi:protein-disulfide isomerase
MSRLKINILLGFHDSKGGTSVRKLIVLCFIVALSISVAAQAATNNKPNQKFVSAEETMKVLQKMGLAQGGKLTFIRSAPTGDKQWQSHLFSVEQDGTGMPLLTYVNSRDVVVGILIRDGKLVVPKMPIEEIQPRIDISKAQLSRDRRITFNSNAKEVIYMFTDPDSSYCQSIEKALPSYAGKYKVIVKQFPLEQAHPGATNKAVEKLCASMSKICDAQTRRYAAQLVQEDIQEGSAIGVDGVPFFITQNGTVLHQLPDIGKPKKK